MKNLTKKLSLFIALAILITIGGVYAVWTYSGSVEFNTTRDFTAQMQTAVNNTGVQGQLKVLRSSITPHITDNYNGNTYVGESAAGDHIAELELTGNMIILFTPYATYTANEGIDLQYVLTLASSATPTYENQNVFAIDSNPQTISKTVATKITEENYSELNTTYLLNAEASGIPLTADDAGSYIYVIEATDANNTIETTAISEILTLNTTYSFTLDTLEKYTAFSDVLGDATFRVTISGAVSAANE